MRFDDHSDSSKLLFHAHVDQIRLKGEVSPHAAIATAIRRSPLSPAARLLNSDSLHSFAYYPLLTFNNTTILTAMCSKTSFSLPGAMLHDAKRLGKILAVLSKYGLDSISDSFSQTHNKAQDESIIDLKSNPVSTAQKIRLVIEELGTTYIKFGQMLSTRSDLLSKEYINELSKLQDNSPELSFETIEEILNEHFGDWHNTFQSIDPHPLGSASIAQVHQAVLCSGEQVVLKIQRPGLLPLIRSDVDILRILARGLDNIIEEISYFNLPELIDEFERTIVEELDFNHERENIEHFQNRYKDNPMFVFPTPNTELSYEKLLVMQKLEGCKITSIEPNTDHAKHLSQAILGIAFDMIFKDGVFHADPHPGNVFATPDGRIALLDFGAVGTFSPRQRELLMRVILAANLGDCGMMARTLLSLGHPTKRVILSDLENDISEILQRHLKASLNSIDVAAFAYDFVSAGQKHAIQIPSEFSSAIRALLSIEGIIQYLEPELDVMKTLATYANKLVTEAFGREALTLNLLQLGINATDIARTVPLQISQIMQDLEHEGLSIRLPDSSSDHIEDAVNALATRLSLTLTFLGLTYFAHISHHPTLFMLACLGDIIWCIILVRWHRSARKSKSRFKILPFIERAKRRKRWF